MPTNTNVYYHKTVAFRFWKQELQFRTSQQLFSAHDIDTGTKFLLRTIVEANYPPLKNILDVGCGYGPLGLTLKKLYPESVVHLFDRDALAVAYTKQNAELNDLKELEIYGSLGYDDVQRNDFDLIVANIPDHAGETVIKYLLQEARYYLKPGGIVAIVVVTPLENIVDKILAETLGLSIILKRDQSRHVVYHYQFAATATSPRPNQNSIERGIYRRGAISMRFGKFDYNLETAYSLPEFDSLSYSSEMLLNALGEAGFKDINNAVVFNPGQGHVAVVLWQHLKPEAITLIDRDLLALRYTQQNLILNGCSLNNVNLLHQEGFGFDTKEKTDLFIGVLREEGKDVSFLAIDQIAEGLANGGMIILSSGSTTITRLTDYITSKGLLRIKGRVRRRGYSSLVLAKI